ncbi:MAG: NAD(+)/NADH kinase [Sporomusaceae bacterium]|jgi:NAD+ kinase|nr:NAD(+)/NADH kinase [Sporomusaceae bacterium]
MLAIGLFPNTGKKDMKKVVEHIMRYLRKREVTFFILEESAQDLGLDCLDVSCGIETMKNRINVAITLGGDGTLLNAAREILPSETAICGVNMGRVGFLAEIELSELEAKLDKIISGSYKINYRLMLDTAVVRAGEIIYEATALNDIVVTKGGLSRMIALKLFVDDEITANYPADGIIVSTPTGSTGYSLSSGGPIIAPQLEVISITPICPHTLQSRPIIVSAEEEIKIKPQAVHNDIILTVDGQNMYNLLPGDTVLIKKSQFKTKLINFPDKSYYATIRTKLRRCDLYENWTEEM